MAFYYKLTSCNVLYPDITPVNTNLTAYIGQIITFDTNLTQSYTVEQFSGFGTIGVDADAINVVPACVACVGYNTHLTLSNNECSCGSIVITDDSTYVNSVAGHDSWGYRKVILLEPNGSEYVWSSESSENPDVVITPYTNVSVNAFTYNFTDVSVDGVYDVKVYSFPNWDAAVMYNSLYGAIVYKNGLLYKISTTNVGEDPELDVDGIYWTPYTISNETLATRYAYEEKIVVLCISLLKCKEGLILDAFCTTETNPCGNLCGNKKYMSAIKFTVVEKAIDISVCQKDWTSVEKQIEILKSICSCGSGC
jgi:hypothetical protein